MPEPQIIEILPDGRRIWRVVDLHWEVLYTFTPDDPVRVLPDGREVAVIPWSYAGAQLSTSWGRTGFWDDTWDYRSVREAVEAAAAWDGAGEPPGWYRHPATGRRRE